jgi:putative tricarboxylic transport membrane protein
MSSSQDSSGEASSPTVLARGPELAVGALLLVVGLIVMRDSVRVGIGWAEDGPRSGYFPFYIGLLLTAAAAVIVARQLIGWARDHAAFATRGELASVWSMAWPMTVYVASIGLLGIYVSSFALIAWFMKRHGTWRWTSVLALAAGVPLLFYVVFERWFLVLLPKGPLEAALGL